MILFDKENKRLGFERADCTAVQEISKPAYLKKDTNENEKIARPGGKTKIPDSTEPENHDSFSLLPVGDTPIKLVLAIILVCAVTITIVFICRRYKNKIPYQHMRNIKVEIPSAGINGRPLNASAAQTPELQNNQPSQDETISDANADQTNPEIRVD